MPRKINYSPPPYNIKNLMSRVWLDWFNLTHQRLGEGPLLIQGYAVASLPTASEHASVSASDPFSSLIFVYNEAGGATLAFSDGTNWRRVQDRTIVS